MGLGGEGCMLCCVSIRWGQVQMSIITPNLHEMQTDETLDTH